MHTTTFGSYTLLSAWGKGLQWEGKVLAYAVALEMDPHTGQKGDRWVCVSNLANRLGNSYPDVATLIYRLQCPTTVRL